MHKDLPVIARDAPFQNILPHNQQIPKPFPLMKLRASHLLALAGLACLARIVCAQTTLSTEISMHTVVTVWGMPGLKQSEGIYMIEATEDPAQVEGWRVVALFKLLGGGRQWCDTTPQAAGGRYYRASVVTVQPVANMAFINPGTFLMGSPDTEQERKANEGPQTQVTFKKGFYMGKCEVTQAEYLAVTGANPSDHQVPEDTSRPVEMVSWNDAVAYCRH